MSVDVYGVDPFLRKELPAKPADNASELAMDNYWQELRDFKDANPGYRFQRSWWTWRPIQILIVKAVHELKLDVPTDELRSLGFNDGIGISNPEYCRAIADYFDKTISELQSKEAEALYLKTSSWTYKGLNEHGNIISLAVSDPELRDKLDNMISDRLFDTLPEINGIEYKSSHAASIDSLIQFSAFLKECNGFVIY